MAVKGYKIAVGALTDKYARLKGKLEALEKEAEGANGVAEIDEAIARIDQHRREIEDSLMHIEEVIWLFDQKWNPAAVRPIRPKRIKLQPGAISKTVYEILRQANRPLSTREIAKEAAVVLATQDLDEEQLAAIDNAVQTTLLKRVGEFIEMKAGPPRLWSVRRVAETGQVDGVASSPAIRATRVA